MFQRILVPVDGSKLAECVFPYVEALAKGCGSQAVILVSVTERVAADRPIIRPAPRPPTVSVSVVESTPDLPETQSITKLPVAVGKMQQQAQKYLHKIAKKLRAKEITVRTKVLLGNPAEEIAKYADADSCDIIVMASHGRSGPSRWTHGSVAEKVFRASRVPVLMVKAPGA